MIGGLGRLLAAYAVWRAWRSRNERRVESLGALQAALNEVRAERRTAAMEFFGAPIVDAGGSLERRTASSAFFIDVDGSLVVAEPGAVVPVWDWPPHADR